MNRLLMAIMIIACGNPQRIEEPAKEQEIQTPDTIIETALNTEEVDEEGDVHVPAPQELELA